jgi:hypothetical protein
VRGFVFAAPVPAAAAVRGFARPAAAVRGFALAGVSAAFACGFARPLGFARPAGFAACIRAPSCSPAAGAAGGRFALRRCGRVRGSALITSRSVAASSLSSVGAMARFFRIAEVGGPDVPNI